MSILKFHRLINVGKIFHPVVVSPKSFNNSYMFKKGGTLSTMHFLKGCNKLLVLVSLGFIHKYLRANPFEEGEFDA